MRTGYVTVCPLTEFPGSFTETQENWPRHITLLPMLDIQITGVPETDLLRVVGDVASRHGQIVVRFGEPRLYTDVMAQPVIEGREDLEELHNDLLSTVTAIGVARPTSPFIRNRYSPHSRGVGEVPADLTIDARSILVIRKTKPGTAEEASIKEIVGAFRLGASQHAA